MMCTGISASKESDVALFSMRRSRVGAGVGVEEVSPAVVEDKLKLLLVDVGTESVVFLFVSSFEDMLPVVPLVLAGIDEVMLVGTDRVVLLVAGVKVALLIDDA